MIKIVFDVVILAAVFLIAIIGTSIVVTIAFNYL